MHAPSLSSECDVTESNIVTLPPILPRFLVPPLVDKPQNPILDTLRGATTASRICEERHFLPELTSSMEQHHDIDRQSSSPASDSLWSTAAKRNTGNISRLMSWDALRYSCSSRKSTSTFLSEQHNTILVAARYRVLPRLYDSTAEIENMNSAELFVYLKTTVLGMSSVLHSWNPSSETFTRAAIEDGHRRLISIDEKDELCSESVIQIFLSIGTLLRRLEILVASLRTRSAQEGPTIHAFAHALSTVITYLREELAQGPPPNDVQPEASLSLATIWLYYEEYEEILIAFSSLCFREQERSPANYPILDSAPASLLSRIYCHLCSHLDRHSPRIIIAAFAYVLETSSRDYLQYVCQSVGFRGNLSVGGPQTTQKCGNLSLSGLRDEFDTQDIVEDLDNPIEEVYPTFFPSCLASSLPTAKKSLGILRAAQADHPFLKSYKANCGIMWVWTEQDIQTVWNDVGKVVPVTAKTNQATHPNMTLHSGRTYQPGLTDFHDFDLEPGSHLAQSFVASKFCAFSTSDLRTFLAAFPESLPAITPTLSHLTSLIFSPLVEHTARLSSDVLSIFLAPSSALNFHTHLMLLRSYLMLTSHSFRSRLAVTLFSDAVDCESDGYATQMSAQTLPSQFVYDNGSTRPWAMGLAPSLTNRETWPPGGADLSFLLRTVIVDSLELGHGRSDGYNGVAQSGRNVVLEEAEFRLGFAIRDLPLGVGRDKWLNPLSIEALDFLYLDYKPPHPLGVLITTEILSKYQRLFAFLLRMMRVESVVCTLFRMTRNKSKPLFPTLASSNKLLIYFQFVAQVFVTSLTSYVFDTAIRSNFDAFLARLYPDAHRSPDTSGFSDVFSLAKSHSAVLDDILFACLLRSGQRAAGDLLRSALEVILDFGILAGELKRGRLEEYEAAPLLEDHYRNFSGKMANLIKALKALAEKGTVSPLPNSKFKGEGFISEPPRGTEMLFYLLIRLDFGDWWSKIKM